MVRDLTTGSVFRELIQFSIPFMLANVLQIFYNLVDMMVVGQFVGNEGLSAVSNGTDVIHLVTLACLGFSMAGQIMIAQYAGRGDREGIRRCIGTLFVLQGGLGVVTMVLGILGTDLMLRMLNVPIDAWEDAHIYCTVCFCGMLFTSGYNLISSILRGMGDSKRPLIFIMVAAAVNLLLDLWFVAGLGLRTFGAALATVIGQAVSVVSSLSYLYIKREAFGFDFKASSFVIHGPTLRALLRLGIPMALQSCAVSLSRLFVNSRINAFGVVVSAVNGVGAKIGQVAQIVTDALGAAGSSMIGQNFAAGKKDRVEQVIYISWGIGLVFTIALSVVVAIGPEQVFGLFNRDPETLALSHSYVVIAILTFIGFALRNPMMSLINGLGCARFAMVLGLLDGIVARILLAVLLGETLGMGIMGFWYGATIAGFVPFVIGGVFFWSGRWKKRKLVI